MRKRRKSFLRSQTFESRQLKQHNYVTAVILVLLNTHAVLQESATQVVVLMKVWLTEFTAKMRVKGVGESVCLMGESREWMREEKMRWRKSERKRRNGLVMEEKEREDEEKVNWTFEGSRHLI